MKVHPPGLVLIAFLVALWISVAARTAAAPDGASVTIWDGVYTEEQARRGQPVYVEQCAFCHGEALTDGTQGPPLAGEAFLVIWQGNTLDALFEKISTMMPSTDPGGLTREQYADILAYMLRIGKAPAGKAELSGDMVPLKQIRIAAKPADKQVH